MPSATDLKMNFRLWTLLICLLNGTVISAEPFLEQTDVFTANTNGVSLYRIPGIVVTTQGTVLAYCEARRNSSADWGEIEVHLRRSLDGGKTWQPAQHIAHVGSRLEGNPRKERGGE